MANTINLRKQYSTLLDEVYKLNSLTAVLDGPNELVREGANANEILIPKMSMQGLADYNKQTGYVAGDVTLEYETKKCAYDRGRMFTIDAMDNIESANIAFGRLSGEFLRTKVVPELDAWRLASYVQVSGITTVKANLSDGKTALAALRTARSKIENAEAKRDRDANSRGTMLLLKVQLIEYHDKYMAMKEIPSYAYDNFCEMYSAYHELGGNGMITKMNEEIHELHIKTKEGKDHEY